MYFLDKIALYDEIVIQCHDNPDPDAIATGFALYIYLKSIGKTDVRLVYGGYRLITKTNIRMLVDALRIPVEHMENMAPPALLVTVDCQYGGGNVTRFEAKKIAVIDHHEQECPADELTLVNPGLSSCATLMWQLLIEKKFPFAGHKGVADVLYYGLYVDSNGFAELRHPLDRDLRDEDYHDPALINRLRHSNLSLEELQIAGAGLASARNNEQYRYTIFKTAPCDPNILGFISDIALQVDSIDVCVVYSRTPIGVKLSIRSGIREVQAAELASYITAHVGNGGGQFEKAGGFISGSQLENRYRDVYGKKYDNDVTAFLDYRLNRYFANSDVIYSSGYRPDLSRMAVYRKKNLRVCYVKTTDIWQVGTNIVIRTLEADINIQVSEEIYIMIGVKGEVHPIRRSKFEQSYVTCEVCEDHAPFMTMEYFPTAKEFLTNVHVDLMEYAKPCIATGVVVIYAKQLARRTKVFTQWDQNSYMHGKKGDFLAIRQDDLQDVYIIDQDIFNQMYEVSEVS